jgi:hypothetical protein
LRSQLQDISPTENITPPKQMVATKLQSNNEAAIFVDSRSAIKQTASAVAKPHLPPKKATGGQTSSIDIVSPPAKILEEEEEEAVSSSTSSSSCSLEESSTTTSNRQEQPALQERLSPALVSSPPPSPAGRSKRTESNSTSTTSPGAIHIPGWNAGLYDDDSSSEGSESSRESEDSSSSSISIDVEPTNTASTATAITSLPPDHIVSVAQLVDEDEMQRHAELLFQQMLAKAAVAELVDEEEMRRRAHEQAESELLHRFRLQDGASVAGGSSTKQGTTAATIIGNRNDNDSYESLLAFCSSS